jgi:hypothetical protein
MDDIRRQDIRLFVKECLDFRRLCWCGVSWFAFYVYSQIHHSVPTFLLGISATTLSLMGIAWSASERKRFIDKRLLSLWNGCQDRLARFEAVLKKMRREQIADLREMPATIRKVSDSLYLALRRADIVANEVKTSEHGMSPPTWTSSSTDPQSRELYRLADKNIAEYRAQFAGVMAGVERTEAQSAVFMTTLDSLRMKIIGYRLVGRSPELGSQDFLEALAEARMQLQSIDSALDELDLGHYPKVISVVPTPGITEEVQNRLG